MEKAKPTSGATPAAVYIAVAALLGWYFLTSVTASIGKSTMFDELFHLTGGYTYWVRSDFRIQPENGNLPQRWDAIPLLFRNTKSPTFSGMPWWKSLMGYVGHEFFYAVGNDADAMLLRGRAMNALFGVALGALVFFAAKSYLGLGPALASLTLFAFCPTILANGAVITSDMAAALFFFATMLCLWRVLQRISWQSVLLSALVMGGLFVAKFAAFMIIPMGLTLAAVQIVSPRPIIVSWRRNAWEIQRRISRCLAIATLVAVHAVIVWAVIWTFYNYRFSMFATTTTQADEHGDQVVADEPLTAWNKVLEGNGPVEQFIQKALPLHLLPEAYLYGFACTWHFSKARAAFFNGSISVTGWPSFFPYCLLVKTPPALFLLLALAAIWLVRTWTIAGEGGSRWAAIGESLYRTAPMWTLFAVYWAFAITSHLNIGHRHILPTYPVMLVFAGASWCWTAGRAPAAAARSAAHKEQSASTSNLVNWATTRRWPAMALLTLVSIVSFAGESSWSWPNYVSYFNQFAGGPRHAYRHLVDSSLDWGQDLPALKQWLHDVGLEDSSDSRTYLSYFGTGSPAYYGIKATLLPCYFQWTPQPLPEPLQPGAYCISATMLQNVYTKYPGPWTKKYETDYREMMKDVNRYISSDQPGRAKLVASTEEAYWYNLFTAYDQLRLARLTSYLRRREPDFEINNSILIFLLSAEQVQSAMEGPLPEMQ